MKLDNKEFLSLLGYRRFLSKALENLISKPDFDINHYDFKILLDLRYVLLLNYLYIYNNYNSLMDEDRSNSQKISFDELQNDIILLKYSKKFIAATEGYWDSNAEMFDSIFEDYFFYGNILEIDDIRKMRSFLYKIITLQRLLLDYSMTLSNLNVNYSEVILPFLKDQIEIIKEENRKVKDKNGDYGFKYYLEDTTYSNKRAELSKLKKLKVVEAKDLVLAVSLSEPQSVLNKEKMRKVHGCDAYYLKNGTFDHPVYQSWRDEFMDLNIRAKKSVIASVILATSSVYEVSMNLLKSKSKNPPALRTLKALYIEHIFIIDADFSTPIFYQKEFYVSGDKSHIYINFLSLYDLTVLYSTLELHKSIKGLNRKNVKFSPKDEIYLRRNMTIDSDMLNNYFYNLIDFKRSIFIFNGFPWNEIVKSFYSQGIEISGGSNTKRHLLSPKDITLSSFMALMQKLTHKETIISNYLVDEKLYKSRFIKPATVEARYRDKWADIILRSVKRIAAINSKDLNKDIFPTKPLDFSPNSQDTYDLYYFILNNYIIRLENDYKNNDSIWENFNFQNSFYSIFNIRKNEIKPKINIPRASGKNEVLPNLKEPLNWKEVKIEIKEPLNGKEKNILNWVKKLGIENAYKKKFFSTFAISPRSGKFLKSNVRLEDKPIVPDFSSLFKEE